MTDKVRFCTADDVRRLIGLTSSAVSDADANALIDLAEAEVEALTHTRFLVTQVSGTVTSGSADGIEDSSKSWTASEWICDDLLSDGTGHMVYITSGKGVGQSRSVEVNSGTIALVTPDFDVSPDSTSKYRIFKNTYSDETFDGDGSDTYFTDSYPILDLRSVTIDSTSVGTATTYLNKHQGKIKLGSSSEKSAWTDTYPLLCNVKYAYGVYPVPAIVKNLCATIAAVAIANYMIGSTYTFATSYSMPDLSVTKGVPYPHFDRALSALTKQRDYLEKQVVKQLVRPMFG